MVTRGHHRNRTRLDRPELDFSLEDLSPAKHKEIERAAKRRIELMQKLKQIPEMSLKGLQDLSKRIREDVAKNSQTATYRGYEIPWNIMKRLGELWRAEKSAKRQPEKYLSLLFVPRNDTDDNLALMELLGKFSKSQEYLSGPRYRDFNSLAEKGCSPLVFGGISDCDHFWFLHFFPRIIRALEQKPEDDLATNLLFYLELHGRILDEKLYEASPIFCAMMRGDVKALESHLKLFPCSKAHIILMQLRCMFRLRHEFRSRQPD